MHGGAPARISVTHLQVHSPVRPVADGRTHRGMAAATTGRATKRACGRTPHASRFTRLSPLPRHAPQTGSHAGSRTAPVRHFINVMWRYGAVVCCRDIGTTFAHWQLTDAVGMFRLSSLKEKPLIKSRIHTTEDGQMGRDARHSRQVGGDGSVHPIGAPSLQVLVPVLAVDVDLAH